MHYFLLLEVFKWTANILSFGGAYLASKKKISCWYLWGTASGIWLIISIYGNLPAESFLWFGYEVMNLNGYLKWRNERNALREV